VYLATEGREFSFNQLCSNGHRIRYKKWWLSGNVDYNYRKIGTTFVPEDRQETPREFAAMTGTDIPTYTREAPGISAFALSDGVVYHSYSAYARGLDALWGMYQWLDRAPKGRNETGPWFRRRDEYTLDSR
jgi:predicted dithiol-disulfide oxidoreductase (DUF899 family)